MVSYALENHTLYIKYECASVCLDFTVSTCNMTRLDEDKIVFFDKNTEISISEEQLELTVHTFIGKPKTIVYFDKDDEDTFEEMLKELKETDPDAYI